MSGTQARGFFKKCRACYEASYGTKPASGDGWVDLPFIDNSIASDEQIIPSTVITGKRWQSQPSRGQISVQGGLTVPLDILNIGYWLKLAFQAPTTTGSNPYTHIFDPTTSTPSMAIENGMEDISDFHCFLGCKVNSIAFDFAIGQELTVTLDIMGKEEEDPDTSTIDNDATSQVITIFTGKQITAKKGGIAVDNITNFNFTVTNNLFGDNYTLGNSGFRANLPETGFTVEGSFTMLYDTTGKATYSQAINATETSLQVACTNGTNSLTFDFYEVEFPRQTPTSSGMGPIVLNQSFYGYYQNPSPDYSVPLRVTLVNSKSSY